MAHVPSMPQLSGFHEKRQPWWAKALLAGIGFGLTLLAGLGLVGAPASGAQQHPVVATSTIAPPGSLSLDERLNRIETALGTMRDEVAEMRAHLPKR